jgi:hypothetical protein
LEESEEAPQLFVIAPEHPQAKWKPFSDMTGEPSSESIDHPCSASFFAPMISL